MSVELLYLDSSAIVKLVSREPETDALVDRLGDDPDVCSSALARVEVPRAAKRAGFGSPARVDDVLERIVMLVVSEAILDRAAAMESVDLRSLDAIHLASAESLGEDLTAFVTYDGRQSTAASGLGLDVVAPT